MGHWSDPVLGDESYGWLDRVDRSSVCRHDQGPIGFGPDREGRVAS